MSDIEVLRRVLAVDCALGAPEIILQEDGDLCLDWSNHDGDFVVSLSIAPSGLVAWAIIGGKHGGNLDEFLQALSKVKP